MPCGYTSLWEGYHESRRCSRDTYPESYITKYTSIRRLTPVNAPAQDGARFESLCAFSVVYRGTSLRRNIPPR